MGFGFWNLPVTVTMERPEMESERERDAVWDGEWAKERHGLRWSEQERDETKKIESERETKDKFVHMLF